MTSRIPERLESAFDLDFTRVAPAASAAGGFATPSSSAGALDRVGVNDGGGIVGDGAIGKSKNAVGITIIDLGVEFGGVDALCGGVIGSKAGKMCIKKGCGIQSHKENKVKISEIGAGPQFFIYTNNKKDSVYVKPSLITVECNADEGALLESEFEVDHWKTIFAKLSERFTSAEETLNLLKTAKKRDARAETPFQDKQFKILSPETEEYLEMSWDTVDVSDLGASASESEKELTGRLGVLWSNVRIVKEAVQKMVPSIRHFQESMEEELNAVNWSLGQLKHFHIGERQDAHGSATVWEALYETEARLGSLEKQGLSESEKAQILDESAGHTYLILEDKKAFLTPERFKVIMEPIMEMYHSVSGSKPGGLVSDLANTVRDLGLRVARLEKAPGTGSSLGNLFGQTAGSVAQSLSTGSGNLKSQAGPTLQEFSALKQELADSKAELAKTNAVLQGLVTQVKDLAIQIDAKSFSINGVFFATPASATAFLKIHKCRAGTGYMLVDPHTFLAYMYGSGAANPMQEAQYDASLSRTKSTVFEKLAISSFNYELPRILGGDEVQSLRQDSRVLPAIKTYAEFIDASGYTGVKKNFMKKILDTKSQIKNIIKDSGLQGDAKELANHMANESASFLTQMLIWMSEEYTELVERKVDPELAWKLICQSVRVIFSELHDVRCRDTSSAYLDDTVREQRVLWGQLRGVDRMAKFLEHNFSGDKALSYILHVFLRDHVYMAKDAKIAFEKVEQRLEDVETKVEKASKAADKANSALGKKK